MYVAANINITNQTVQALPKKDAIVRNGDKYIYIQKNTKKKHQKQKREANIKEDGEKKDTMKFTLKQ
jgi:cobalt-zinc-cadmium efflux system membrane fusion protein